MVTTEKYQRKPFEVDAVRVTQGNLQELAEWCGGVVREADGLLYIKVNVSYPQSERQTRAFPGDWLLKSGSQFKVFLDKAFKAQFVKINSSDSSK